MSISGPLDGVVVADFSRVASWLDCGKGGMVVR